MADSNVKVSPVDVKAMVSDVQVGMKVEHRWCWEEFEGRVRMKFFVWFDSIQESKAGAVCGGHYRW